MSRAPPAPENVRNALADAANDGRWAPAKRALEWALEKRWPVLLFQTLNGTCLFFLGKAYAQGVDAAVLFVGGAAFVLVFGFGQYLLVETPKQIKDRLARAAADSVAAITMQMDTFFTSENFLLSRMRKMIEVLAALQADQPNVLQMIARQSLVKEDLLNAALRDLCGNLTAIAAKTLQVPLQKAQFRATFMEVQGEGSEEKLVYVGWHTWDGSISRSMKEGVTMRRGEKCAGLAWQRGRVVIEKEFKDGHEWQNNYSGQNLKYKSMISAPVRRGYSYDPENIVGVITVDTQLDGYFGEKDDEQQEKRWGAMAQPYGTYIAFVCALEITVGRVREALIRQDVSGEDILPKLGAAPPMCQRWSRRGLRRRPAVRSANEARPRVRNVRIDDERERGSFHRIRDLFTWVRLRHPIRSTWSG
jgi:hypothetical protein